MNDTFNELYESIVNENADKFTDVYTKWFKKTKLPKHFFTSADNLVMELDNLEESLQDLIDEYEDDPDELADEYATWLKDNSIKTKLDADGLVYQFADWRDELEDLMKKYDV